MTALDDDGTRHFERMYRENLRDVKRYAATLVGRSLVEDVASETFAIAWQRFSEIPPSSQRAWLLGVVRNCCRTRWRSDRRRLALVEEIARRRSESPASLRRGGVDVDLLLVFESVLKTLGSADRDVLVLSAWFGMSDPEIARVLRSTPDRVRKRRNRLEHRLASQLGVPIEEDQRGVEQWGREYG